MIDVQVGLFCAKPAALEANAVSVRVHGKGSLGAKPKAEVVTEILAAIRDRRA